jgi:hypothetical protein
VLPKRPGWAGGQWPAASAFAGGAVRQAPKRAKSDGREGRTRLGDFGWRQRLWRKGKEGEKAVAKLRRRVSAVEIVTTLRQYTQQGVNATD